MRRKSNEISLGDAITRYLESIGIKEKVLVQRVIDRWPEIMGKAVHENTERIWFSDGVLNLKIPNPIWKQELGMGKTKIRERLNEELGAGLIKEIRIH